MKPEIREVLEKPFPPEVIKQREGSFGRTLDYVEAWAVIARLTEAFDGDWSFDIQSYRILDEEVIALGKLAANGLIKSQFGSAAITRAKDTGKAVSLGDDIKAAATDALKKCATLMGVALYLYNGNGVVSSGAAKNPQTEANGVYCGAGSGNLPSGGSGAGTSSQEKGNGRISTRQLNFVLKLGKNIGWTSKELNEEALKAFGVKLDFLSVKEASAFIDILKAKASK
jgi:hypothetical protein